MASGLKPSEPARVLTQSVAKNCGLKRRLRIIAYFYKFRRKIVSLFLTNKRRVGYFFYIILTDGSKVSNTPVHTNSVPLEA